MTYRPTLALQFCWSYAELVERVADQEADPSLLAYALYHSGSVDVINPTLSLADMTAIYRRNTTDRNLVAGLTAFAQMCIARNLIRYTQHLLTTVGNFVTSGYNGRMCAIPSSTTLELAAGLHARGILHISSALQETENNIDGLTGALFFDAVASVDRVPSCHLDQERLKLLVDVLSRWICSLEGVAGFKDPNIPQRDFLYSGNLILKTAVALQSMMMDVSLEQIRSERHHYLGVLPRHNPERPELSASDMTLAALPRPTQDLIRLCQSQGNTSTTGRLYVKLHQLVTQDRVAEG